MTQEEQERLEQVRVRLKTIEREDRHQNDHILIKPVENQVIVSARKCPPLTDDTSQQCSQLAAAVHAWLRQAGGRLSSYWFSIYHQTSIESHNERIDIEIATRVEPSLLTKHLPDNSGTVTVRELPGTPTMAYLLYQGSYDGLWDAYIALMVWIESHSYQSAGPSRYIYLRLPQQGEEPLTEIQIPIEQVLNRK